MRHSNADLLNVRCSEGILLKNTFDVAEKINHRKAGHGYKRWNKREKTELKKYKKACEKNFNNETIIRGE